MTEFPIKPDVRRQAQDILIADYRQRAAIIEREAGALVIDSDAADRAATQLLGAIATLKKAAEVKRVELVAPLNYAVTGINAAFREALSPILVADTTLRANSKAWWKQEQARAEAARRAADQQRREAEAMLKEAEQAERQGDAAAADALVTIAAGQEEAAAVSKAESAAPPSRVSTPFGTRSVRHGWAFEVTHLDLVPCEYLDLNESRVRKAIASGLREIPGLRIYPDETLIVRGR